MYVCIYMYEYMYTYMYVYMYIQICIYVFIHMYFKNPQFVRLFKNPEAWWVFFLKTLYTCSKFYKHIDRYRTTSGSRFWCFVFGMYMYLSVLHVFCVVRVCFWTHPFICIHCLGYLLLYTCLYPCFVFSFDLLTSLIVLFFFDLYKWIW